MSSKTRTSLTLSPQALSLAKSRSKALGYESVSEYIQFLILEDARQKRRHTITRDAHGVSYHATSAGPHPELLKLEAGIRGSSESPNPVQPLPKVAEPPADYPGNHFHDPPEDDDFGH